jgi:hypothetical protein
MRISLNLLARVVILTKEICDFFPFQERQRMTSPFSFKVASNF